VKYRDTRHNVGFRVIDEVARRSGAAFDTSMTDALVARVRGAGADTTMLLVKPLTMMNLSGEAVSVLARYYRVDVPDLLIVADDTNLQLARLRARARGSSGGHNGFKSIAQHLGTWEFARLRVGVGRGDGRRDLADHVLARFDADEQPIIEAAIGRAADAVETFVSEGLGAVMNRFNPVVEDEETESTSPGSDTQS
jgi:PTH1 family peptidyl-tRNA hydrolase